MAALQEVPVASLSPERFESLLGQGWKQVDEAIDEARRLLKGRVVWNVNSTARGGGVAELLQSLLAYARGAGVDVRWLTISGNPDFFRVTKRIHNRLHESEGDGGPLGPEEREVYESALAEAADELVQLVQPGDIVDIHDPQPAGLLPHVVSADVKVIWRCHIGVDRPGELARGAWDFMRRYIEDADAYIFSRKPFVWDGLDQNRIWIIPPSIDAFSPKNEELSPEAVGASSAAIGLQDTADPGHALFQRFDGTESRVTRSADLTQDGPLPEDAPVVCQVSRWDRLKDPVGVQRSFAEFVESEAAHLVLAGPSVAECPTTQRGSRSSKRSPLAARSCRRTNGARVHLVSLPTDDIEENAAMVNAIQRRSTVVLQKSLAEGFGLTVAEAMWKSRPMVASRVGGIQDQIEDGVSGVLIDDPTDLLAVAQAVDGFHRRPGSRRRGREGGS
jgi:trehalose synthase